MEKSVLNLYGKSLEVKCINSWTAGLNLKFLGCSSGWTEFQRSCYILVQSSYYWTDADLHCRGLGANLTSIHSKEENDFIFSLASNYDIWIGGTLESYQQWRSTDGSSWDYEYWIADQPSYGGDDSVSMDDDQNGAWRDMETTEDTRYFVCRMF